ncbi:tetratricopeptide repeat protein [Swingsia samuiensis]|uniref:Tetratricopeptide repeat protein n=1 Tax=Swingsia samuiensis TaxID=1293412 RepID=A0A4Y6UIW8_9PROT|nr:tetratricopeptide repeat protein [Swingsia samuiensis]QDH17569.1 tetratricopeptide repeat protein [Swingsia samuiensis]
MTNNYSFDPTKIAFDYLEQGRTLDAEERFRSLLKTDPRQPDALHGMACVARHKGQNATAIALMGLALKNAAEVSPSRRARMHITLGAALLEEGHVEPARAALSVATVLQPADHRAHAALAQALLVLNRRDEAMASLQVAADLASHDQIYLTQLGQLSLEDGLLKQSIRYFEEAVRSGANDGAAWANLGAALFSDRQFEKAQEVLGKAEKLGAKTAETYNNLGLVQMALGDLSAAKQSLIKALTLRPHDARIANSLGTALMELGDEEKAQDLFECIVKETTGYDGNQARFNLATLLLGKGEFEKGWVNFESRHSLLGYQPALPVWKGDQGETPVLVTAEQGLGDSLQFLRFLKSASKKRPLELDFPAASLTDYMPDLEKARVVIGKTGRAKSEVSLLSLPYILNEKEAPSSTPYVMMNIEPDHRRIGLCWSGNASYQFDRRRSIPVELFEPFKELASDVDFVALQPGEHPDWMHKISSFETITDLAVAVAKCSLVISVDTLVAHMAGAQGRPLWLLNRFGGDWRWKNIEWYQNVKQFRPDGSQSPYEGWKSVIAKVKKELREQLNAHHL